MKLNSAQNQAVKYISGPCLVLAGAGSGKTRVITNKIAYLIEQCQYSPRHIAALTFTNKAAKEMKERVAHTLGKDRSRGLTVSTFHTLGLNIIKREINTLGYKANFSLFDDSDTSALLKELSEKDLQGDKDSLNQLKWSISNWKSDLILPAAAAQHARTANEQLFAQYYQIYQRQLRSYNALDFDDLILVPTLLLKGDPQARQRWQNNIRYLLVDEYQDTNISQYELVKLLVGPDPRFTVVGDDDQSIYSWRGAKPENLTALNADYPQLNVIKLEQNYRSSQRILKAANILIANNPHEYTKTLFSELAYGLPLKVLTTKNEDHEAERVIAEIISHRFQSGTDYGDYAILYRGNFQSRVFEKSLLLNRIPYRITGGLSFFARSEIKDIMAYLRLLINPDDDNAYLRIVNVPKREIGPATLEKVGSYANQHQISLFAASLEPGLAASLTESKRLTVHNFVRWLVETADQATRGDPVAGIREFFRVMHYDDWLYETSPSPKAAEMRIKNVNQLFNWLTDLLAGDEDTPPLTLTEAVKKLALRDMLERNEEQELAGQVQLMTLHSSKGLEFPYVYMVGMEEGLLPHQTNIDLDDVDEERRLAYVGITRAQRELTFTITRERRQYGETIQPEPSRFLYELPQDDLEWTLKKRPATQAEKQASGDRAVSDIRSMLARAKKNK